MCYRILIIIGKRPEAKWCRIVDLMVGRRIYHASGSYNIISSDILRYW